MKILFLYADEEYFWRNRLGLACEAREQGFEVVLMAPFGCYRSEIEKEGIRMIPWNLSRKSVNPFRELPSLLEVIRAYRQERPDFVQHEMLKAIIHGGIAARLAGEIGSVNVICGLGTIFIRSDIKMAIIRRLVLLILSSVFRSPCAQVVLQNDANRDLLVKTYRVLRAEQAHVSAGNGDSIGRFTSHRAPTGKPAVST